MLCGINEPGTKFSRSNALDLQGWQSVSAMLSGALPLLPDPEEGSQKGFQRPILLYRRISLYPSSIVYASTMTCEKVFSSRSNIYVVSDLRARARLA